GVDRHHRLHGHASLHLPGGAVRAVLFRGDSENRGVAFVPEGDQAGAGGVARKSPSCRRFGDTGHNLVVLGVLCYAAAAITETRVDFRNLGNGFRNQTCTKKHSTGFTLADDTHTALPAFALPTRRSHPGLSLALVSRNAGRDGGRAGARLVRK